MRKVMLAAVAAMIVSGGAVAGNMGASLNYGLGGVGVDVGYAIMPDFVNLRAGFNAGLDVSGTTTPDQIKYDYKLDTGYKSLGVDWHPFGGGFRLSAGYAWSNTQLDVLASAAAGANFGGAPLPNAVTVDGRVAYKDAPYVSLGWGNHAPRKAGFFFNSEFGVMLTGKPDVSVNEAALLAAGATQAQINNEKDKIKNDALDLFPIVKLGAGYSF